MQLPLQHHALQRLLTTSHRQQFTVQRPADLLVPLAAKMSEEPFRLVIMDSVVANLRVDFTGRGIPSSALHAVRLENLDICAPQKHMSQRSL